MSGVSITGLNPASTLTGAEIVPIVQSGTTVRTTTANLGPVVSYTPAGTGSVTTTVQTKLRETVSVKDFGAVGDAVISGNSVSSGTDNLTAFNNAFSYAVSSHISEITVPSGFYYISAPITLPRGITLTGEGTSHLPIVTQSSYRTGTCLLIAGTVGTDCLAFESNAGHSAIQNMSVYNTNTNAIRSVVSIIGQQYPSLINVEIGSLKKTTGCGLWISPSATGAEYETLWGAFHNVIVTIVDIGSANEASVRYGAIIYGFSSTKRCNANSFVSGQFAGTWAGLLIDGDSGDTGALSCVFHGVKFDTIWDGTYTPEYRATADGVFGWNKTNCYIAPVVQLNKGQNIDFHGCYFESAGFPATYNDGTHGSYTLLPVFYNGGGTTVNIGTNVLGCNWNNTYLFDISSSARVDPVLSNRYATRNVENLLVLASSTQTISAYTWTKVQLSSTTQFGDNSYLEWDSTNNAAKIRSPGTYLISGQFEFNSWAVTAGTWASIRIQTDAGYTYQGAYVQPIGAGNGMNMQVQICMDLLRGQSVWLEVIQNQGTNQTSSGSNTRLNVTKIV